MSSDALVVAAPLDIVLPPPVAVGGDVFQKVSTVMAAAEQMQERAMQRMMQMASFSPQMQQLVGGLGMTMFVMQEATVQAVTKIADEVDVVKEKVGSLEEQFRELTALEPLDVIVDRLIAHDRVFRALEFIYNWEKTRATCAEKIDFRMVDGDSLFGNIVYKDEMDETSLISHHLMLYANWTINGTHLVSEPQMTGFMRLQFPMLRNYASKKGPVAVYSLAKCDMNSLIYRVPTEQWESLMTSIGEILKSPKHMAKLENGKPPLRRSLKSPVVVNQHGTPGFTFGFASWIPHDWSQKDYDAYVRDRKKQCDMAKIPHDQHHKLLQTIGTKFIDALTIKKRIRSRKTMAKMRKRRRGGDDDDSDKENDCEESSDVDDNDENDDEEEEIVETGKVVQRTVSSMPVTPATPSTTTTTSSSLPQHQYSVFDCQRCHKDLILCKCYCDESETIEKFLAEAFPGC